MRLISNISKDAVSSIPPMAPLISISDRYSSRPTIPHKEQRPLLMVDFFPGDHLEGSHYLITEQMALDIKRFIDSVPDGEHIYVHCTEGRIRSYTVVTALCGYIGNLQRCTKSSSIKTGVIDRYTDRVLFMALSHE